MLSLPFLLLSTIAPAFAAPGSSPGTQSVHISWFKDSATGASSLTVSSEQDDGPVYGESCSDALNIGGTLVSIDADDRGRGKITIAGKAYDIAFDEQGDAPISCTRAYNSQTTEVDCAVQWTSALPSEFEGGGDCFNGTAPSGLGRRAAPLGAGGLEARQMYSCPYGEEWRPVGDGNVKDREYRHQLTNAITCDGRNSCSIQHEEGKSFTIGFEATAAVSQWFGLGLGVQKSVSVAETKVCDGEGSDTVCVWWKQPYKQYTAQNWALAPMGPGCRSDEFKIGDPVTFKSPIPNAGVPYCVVGHCRKRGDGYWDKEPMSKEEKAWRKTFLKLFVGVDIPE